MTDRHNINRGRTPLVLLSVSLLAMLGVTRARYNATIQEARTLVDSARAVGARALAQRDSALGAGDSLPDIHLLDQQGMQVSLKALPARKYSFLYFHRDDCPACVLLHPFLDTLSSPHRERIAWIAYSRATALPLPLSLHRFALSPANGTAVPPLAWAVPQLVAIDEEGVVLGVASGVDKVTRLLSLHGIINGELVDSSIALARRAGAASVTPTTSIPDDSSLTAVQYRGLSLTVGDNALRPELAKRVDCRPTGAALCVIDDPVMVSVGADGTLLVTTMLRGARLMRPDTTPVLQLGRTGHGRGQYEALLAAGFAPNGGILLFDPTSSTTLRYNLDGVYRESQKLRVPDDLLGAGVGPDGLLVLVAPVGRVVGEPVQARVLLVNAAATGNTTLASFVMPAVTTRVGFHPLPNFFQPSPQLSVCPDGGFVYVEPSSSMAIGIRRSDQRIASRVAGLWEGRPVTKADVEAEYARRGLAPQSALRLGADTAVSHGMIGTRHPAITAAVCGQDAVLLRESPPVARSDSVRWRLLDLEGTLLGLVPLGVHDRVLAQSGRALLVARTTESRARELWWLTLSDKP